MLQLAASHSPIALIALIARECPNKIQRSKGAAVGIQYESLVMSIAVGNLESRSNMSKQLYETSGQGSVGTAAPAGRT